MRKGRMSAIGSASSGYAIVAQHPLPLSSLAQMTHFDSLYETPYKEQTHYGVILWFSIRYVCNIVTTRKATMVFRHV